MTDYHIARPEEKTLIDRITKAIAEPEARTGGLTSWIRGASSTHC